MRQRSLEADCRKLKCLALQISSTHWRAAQNHFFFPSLLELPRYLGTQIPLPRVGAQEDWCSSAQGTQAMVWGLIFLSIDEHGELSSSWCCDAKNHRGITKSRGQTRALLIPEGWGCLKLHLIKRRNPKVCALPGFQTWSLYQAHVMRKAGAAELSPGQQLLLVKNNDGFYWEKTAHWQQKKSFTWVKTAGSVS